MWYINIITETEWMTAKQQEEEFDQCRSHILKTLLQLVFTHNPLISDWLQAPNYDLHSGKKQEKNLSDMLRRITVHQTTGRKKIYTCHIACEISIERKTETSNSSYILYLPHIYCKHIPSAPSHLSIYICMCIHILYVYIHICLYTHMCKTIDSSQPQTSSDAARLSFKRQKYN